MLPPIGHSRFCLQYPDDLPRFHGVDFRRRNIALTMDRWNELNSVNRDVNREIVPEVTFGNGAKTEQLGDLRHAGPADCKDYAIVQTCMNFWHVVPAASAQRICCCPGGRGS